MTEVTSRPVTSRSDSRPTEPNVERPDVRAAVACDPGTLWVSSQGRARALLSRLGVHLHRLHESDQLLSAFSPGASAGRRGHVCADLRDLRDALVLCAVCGIKWPKSSAVRRGPGRGRSVAATVHLPCSSSSKTAKPRSRLLSRLAASVGWRLWCVCAQLWRVPPTTARCRPTSLIGSRGPGDFIPTAGRRRLSRPISRDDESSGLAPSRAVRRGDQVSPANTQGRLAKR